MFLGDRMTDTVHKGQVQVVEGSAVGEFYVVPKFAYDSAFNVEYLGEAKIGKPDNSYSHFINKFIYDPAFNLLRILIATNRLVCDCTDVTIATIGDARVRVTANNGDFASSFVDARGKENERDILLLTTGINEINGKIIEKVSETEVIVDIMDNSSITPEVNAIISTSDMIMQLNNPKTKDFVKRRWDLRERYIYDTQQG